MPKPKLMPPVKVIPLDDPTRKRIEIIRRVKLVQTGIVAVKANVDVWEDLVGKLLEELKAEGWEGRKQC